ncbi:MAG: HAMP domain-containing histidine kinase [Firmicutes bacterium]|nr:HAMP domain-containing histidine kinase [Bacillota bacterium]
MYLLCGFLLSILIFLSARLLLIHRSLEEICSGLSHILGSDTQKDVSTNALLCVSSRDPYIRRLAARLNEHLSRLRNRQLQYENGDRELKEAITNVSHDLRTPLTAMAGYLELLRKELAATGQSSGVKTADRETAFGQQDDECTAEKAARYLSILQNRLDAMKQLTEELFRYSVALSFREIAPVALSLNRILEDSLMAYWDILEQRGITPVISMPESPVTRTLDTSSLSRIFSNILSNAVKYSDGDLQVTLTENGVITFSNHAAGLTPVTAAKLFDRFYTVETASPSTGLGLSIARLLTERMGGSINASYENGELHIILQFPGE